MPECLLADAIFLNISMSSLVFILSMKLQCRRPASTAPAFSLTSTWSALSPEETTMDVTFANQADFVLMVGMLQNTDACSTSSMAVFAFQDGQFSRMWSTASRKSPMSSPGRMAEANQQRFPWHPAARSGSRSLLAGKKEEEEERYEEEQTGDKGDKCVGGDADGTNSPSRSLSPYPA